MEPSVESLCNLLARSRLVQADEVRAIHQRWAREPAAAGADGGRFAKWLAANHYVTEYQAGLLLRGHADNFFLGPYKILDRIGKGRMAGVYQAVHELGQVVAIKVLPPSKAKDPQQLGRFQREARLAVRLKHPNVVRTFQVGEFSGLHCLVMEYLEGETLEEVLKVRGRLPPAEAARVVYQALLGLQYLHEQSMVHRDLKPANLMLVSAPGRNGSAAAGEVVKILDIGVGKVLFDEGEPTGPTVPVLTNQGDLLGEPLYMAPEQARDARTADVRADIYSLGCVLYHALAGQPPFQETNMVRLLVRHATEPPRPVCAFDSKIPEGLQAVVQCMLAKDPSLRYPAPAQAAQALQPFLSASGESRRPPAVDPYEPSYLHWLERDGAAVASAPTLPPAPLVAAAPAVPAATVREVDPPPPKRRTAVKPVQPAVKAPEEPPRPRTLVEFIPDKALQRQLHPEAAPLELNRRDWLLVGAGALAVLVAEGLGWILVKLLRGRGQGREAPESVPDKPGSAR